MPWSVPITREGPGSRMYRATVFRLNGVVRAGVPADVPAKVHTVFAAGEAGGPAETALVDGQADHDGNAG